MIKFEEFQKIELKNLTYINYDSGQVEKGYLGCV